MSITFGENRPLNRRRSGVSVQRFAALDARSAHFEMRTEDVGVVIKSFAATDPRGSRVGLGLIEAARLTSESLSLYSSIDERPHAIDVEVRLAPALHVRLMAAGLAALTIAATVGALLLDGGTGREGGKTHEAFVAELALLAVPTTLAVALLLVREQTALAHRLQAAWRIVLAIAAYPASQSQEVLMAKNGAHGGGRIGPVKGRSQSRSPKTGLWSKRDTSTGRFMDVKKSGGSFKGVRREK